MGGEEGDRVWGISFYVRVFQVDYLQQVKLLNVMEALHLLRQNWILPRTPAPVIQLNSTSIFISTASSKLDFSSIIRCQNNKTSTSEVLKGVACACMQRQTHYLFKILLLAERGPDSSRNSSTSRVHQGHNVGCSRINSVDIKPTGALNFHCTIGVAPWSGSKHCISSRLRSRLVGRGGEAWKGNWIYEKWLES